MVGKLCICGGQRVYRKSLYLPLRFSVNQPKTLLKNHNIIKSKLKKKFLLAHIPTLRNFTWYLNKGFLGTISSLAPFLQHNCVLRSSGFFLFLTELTFSFHLPR